MGTTITEITEFYNQLEAIPFRPRFLPGAVATSIWGLPDVPSMFFDTSPRTVGKLYRYPPPFVPVKFTSDDGTPLAGLMALQPDQPRPGVVIVHGLFASKNALYVKKPALKAYREWGFNVIVPDLRVFGESRYLSGAQSTGSWREGQDVLAAAEILADVINAPPAVMGFSMGAASVLQAAAQARAGQIAGTLAVSPYSDLRRQVAYISRRPKPWEGYSSVYPVFSLLLRRKRKDMGLPKGIDTFAALLEQVSALYYHMTSHELYQLGSPGQVVKRIQVPTLIIHGKDDPIIPVVEAEELARNAVNNPWVKTMIMPKGGHCAFDIVEPSWTWSVYQRFLLFVTGYRTKAQS
ncbi:MAG: alpha/beta fold hydrolase [Clostridia bacterium]|nr:alpha/beta fold hydrolase [Clostridia bacterium]